MVIQNKYRGKDSEHVILKAFAGHEALLRAGLSLSIGKTNTDGLGQNRVLSKLLSMTLVLPGKSRQFHRLRVASAAKSILTVSASEVFSMISGPAVAGNAEGALALAELMPDENSPDPSQSKRHRYGVCGFFHMGLNDDHEKAVALAVVHARVNGMVLKIDHKESVPRNAFFWIAIQAREARQAGHSDADVWEAAATLLVSRCPDGVVEGSETLSLALGSRVLRNALIKVRPKLGDPGSYCFHRESTLVSALQEVPAGEVGEILAYAESAVRYTRIPPKGKTSVRESFEYGIPGWALALLAGHKPDPAWMPSPGDPEALGVFKMPRAFIEASKSGALRSSDLDHWRGRENSASFDAARLCKELGHGFGLAAPKRLRKAKVAV